jgi:hypothetical protein
MASSTSSSSFPQYSTADPSTVQAFARNAQLELLDFVRSMIEQRRLRDPMGGKARAGDKFMVEVDQFVIGLREPQFEKCKSLLVFSSGGAGGRKLGDDVPLATCSS